MRRSTAFFGHGAFAAAGIASNFDAWLVVQRFLSHGFVIALPQHVPPPAGLKPPVLWGTEPHIAELFGPQAEQIQ